MYPSGDTRRPRKGVRRRRKEGAARGGVPVERDPRELELTSFNNSPQRQRHNERRRPGVGRTSESHGRVSIPRLGSHDAA